jgi:hypothetical protein
VQSPGEFAFFPIEPLVIDDEPYDLGLAQILEILALEALLKRFGRSEKLRGVELIEFFPSNITVGSLVSLTSKR